MKNSTLKLLATLLLTLLVYTVNAQIQVCEGGSVNLKTDVDPLNGGSDPDGTPGSFYTWSADNGATYTDFAPGSNPNGDSNKATFDFTGILVGTTVTISVFETNAGCVGATITYTVEVIAGPDVTLVDPDQTPICLLTDAKFNITGTANAIVTYSLDGGATTATIALDGTGNAQVDASGAPVVGGVITIIIDSVANVAGTCSNSTPTASTATITVNNTPETSPIQVL